MPLASSAHRGSQQEQALLPSTVCQASRHPLSLGLTASTGNVMWPCQLQAEGEETEFGVGHQGPLVTQAVSNLIAGGPGPVRGGDTPALLRVPSAAEDVGVGWDLWLTQSLFRVATEITHTHADWVSPTWQAPHEKHFTCATPSPIVQMKKLRLRGYSTSISLHVAHLESNPDSSGPAWAPATGHHGRGPCLLGASGTREGETWCVQGRSKPPARKLTHVHG